MNLQPTLQNKLIHIRPLTEDDFEALYKAANDPLIWEQHPCKRNERAEFETYFKESIASKGALVIQDPSTSEIIGSSRFKLLEGFPKGVEIEWTFLSRDYWGGKFNKSVKSLMMDHAFSSVEIVVLFIDKNNIRSQKAAEKIGGRSIDQSQYPELPGKGPEKLIYFIEKP